MSLAFWLAAKPSCLITACLLGMLPNASTCQSRTHCRDTTPAVHPRGAGIQGWGQAKRTAVNLLLLAGAEPWILSWVCLTGLKGNALKKQVSVLIVSIKRKMQYSHEPLLHEMNLILYNFIGSKYFFKVTLHWLSQHDVSSLLGSAPDYPIFCWDLSLRFLSIPLSSNSPLWLLCCPDPCLLAVSVHLQEMMELI